MLYANIREFKFLSEFDELEISAVNAIPLDTVHGVVQIVHGLCEHKEMYFPFMDYLAEQGFITVISDNRGHGQSICAPDDLGNMFQNGGEGLVSDLAQLNKFNKTGMEQYSGIHHRSRTRFCCRKTLYRTARHRY